ncbi:ParB/RepB/Spo0J family partition protein [Roseibacillus persicicus]|uniref:Chromosome partitioning protein ParB n=1 Tax=Roseibacillus persicicus TaxID=454148 RepID=A0A918TI36_9BACT|nr:ParB/RepB/Spo0J family partition protein [Roseibacillus persicicus]MDQ8191210.1 ParB/RepB/Spo0J family partition protein [Roseibacillus persicicus]GHC48041.1 chromosome partitioning protein ParB [Roseibacillus persicicus]
MAKQALGKGLGALINNSGSKAPSKVSPDSNAMPSDATASVREVPLSQVRPSPLQPRTHFVEGELDELVESIKHHGVIQPLIVRPVDGELELIAGERRWRASKKIGLKTVPIIEREATDREVLEMALIENLQRADLNPMEEAMGYVRLAREFGLKQEEISKTVGKSRASVANSMRLLDLHKDVQPLVAQGSISVGHAKAILSIKDGKAQKVAAQEIIRRKLTVRATEKLIQDYHRETDGKQRKTRSKKEITPELAALYSQIESKLRSKFQTQVSITPGADKGRIEIVYYKGDDGLNNILEIMGISLD